MDFQKLAALSAQGLSQREIAQQLGCNQSSVSRALARISVSQHRANAPEAPPGFRVKGVSTLYKDGVATIEWVKTSADEEQRRAQEEAAFRAMAEELPRVEPTPAPADVLQRLLNLYTITDSHVGALAWARETGAPWDLKIAEDTLTQTFLRMIATAPPAKVGVVNQLGDFIHFDGLTPTTPTSGHILDADSRYQKVVEVAVRILRRIVDAALARHEKVVVYMHEGNHDMAGSVWLRVMFAALYENEPRVTVEQSPLPYVALQHGKTMLAFHHGHLAKKNDTPLLFAARFPLIWGATTKRYIHSGHYHHVEVKEHPGVKWEQHPTLAAEDAYSARGGWVSERQASAITYHDEYGEVARTTFTPELVQ